MSVITADHEFKAAYLISMWKFWERSAARLVVGDDPRTGFMVK
jgi:hypothetical protein